MPSFPPSGNAFLDALPESTLEALRPHLVAVPLLLGDGVSRIGDDIGTALFPTSGVISIVADLAGGGTVEIGIVGREGTTGSASALGQSTATYRSLVQVAGGALALPADVLRASLARDAELRAHALRYVYGTIVALSQSAACNRMHSVGERCARWLLLVHDRVDGDAFVLTQEFLGQMLGVRRASVTVAAATLQNAGLISYRRGGVTVVDRAGLEAWACECYRAVERRLRIVTGYSIAKGEDARTRASGDPDASPCAVTPLP